MHFAAPATRRSDPVDTMCLGASQDATWLEIGMFAGEPYGWLVASGHEISCRAPAFGAESLQPELLRQRPLSEIVGQDEPDPQRAEFIIDVVLL